MKLSDVKRKSGEAKEGVWIEDLRNYEGLRLRVRSWGNADWLRIQASFETPPVGESAADKRKREIAQLGRLIREAGITDWNITDDQDKSVAYDPSSKEAKELTEDEEVQAAIQIAMMMRAAEAANSKADAKKN